MRCILHTILNLLICNLLNGNYKYVNNERISVTTRFIVRKENTLQILRKQVFTSKFESREILVFIYRV